MRTELCYPHETFYLQLSSSRDVTDNKSADPVTPPLKDCHSPTSPSPPSPTLLMPSPLQLHQQQQQIQQQQQQALLTPTQYRMPPMARQIQSNPDRTNSPVSPSPATTNNNTNITTTTDHAAGADVSAAPVQPQLNHEEARRKTFTAAWPHAFLDTALLAQTGFYFIGPNDNVKCHFCKVEIGRWETHDHEVTEHQRWSQNCPLLKRRQTNNVPLDAVQLDHVLPPLTIDVCGPGGIDVRHNTISEGSFDVYPAMAAVVPTAMSAPSAPGAGHDLGPDMHYQSNAAPLADAHHQQQHQQQQQQQHHHPQMQPVSMLQHNHHNHSASISVQTAPSIRYPDHPEYAIESARLRSFDDWPKTMKQKPKELSDAGFFYTMKGDRVKCFSCGGGLRDWDENDVPWEQHAQWFGHCQYLQLIKGQEYVDEVLRLAAEAKSTAAAAAALAQPQSAEATSATATAQADTKTAAAAAAATAVASAASAASSAGAADEQNGGRKICDSKLCKICYSCEYNTAFLPCGHVVACAKCASSVTKCPMCRKPFERVMRVYFS